MRRLYDVRSEDVCVFAKLNHVRTGNSAHMWLNGTAERDV